MLSLFLRIKVSACLNREFVVVVVVFVVVVVAGVVVVVVVFVGVVMLLVRFWLKLFLYF